MPESGGQEVRKRLKPGRVRRGLSTLLRVLGLVSSIHAVLTVPVTVIALAWVLTLNALPVVTVPFYWFFGRYQYDAERTLPDAPDPLLEQLRSDLRETAVEWSPDPSGGAGPLEALRRVAYMPFTGANRVELLVDGPETLGSISRGIREAESYVLFQFYIVRDDSVGRAIRDQLLERSASGLDVYFLYDDVGSRDLPDRFLEELRTGGVQVFRYSVEPGGLPMNFRNHRKVVVVDGKEAWIGGLNVGDEYLGLDPEVGPWRDTHVHFRGPAALAAQLAFAEDWQRTTGRVPALSWVPPALEDPDRSQDVLVLGSGPADDPSTVSLLVHQLIEAAEERLWIATPYFLPEPGILDALRLAHLRGVDVQILVPERSDHRVVDVASWPYLQEMLDAGIAVHRYRGGFMHQKVFLVDQQVAAITSANMDYRSFHLNFEITAVVAGSAFNRNVAAMFRRDLDHSRPMGRNEFQAKPIRFRFLARFLRLAEPLL